MDDKDNGGTSALIDLIAHESSHSEKYGETSGNLLIEEGFANSKEELARDKFKETDKTLSEKEKKEALAEIKKDVATERAISDSLTVNSKDEPVENSVVAAPLAANPWGLGVITVGAIHFYAYNNIPTYKSYVDNGILKFDEGRLYLRGKLIEGFDWTVESISKILKQASASESKNQKEKAKDKSKEKEKEKEKGKSKDKKEESKEKSQNDKSKEKKAPTSANKLQEEVKKNRAPKDIDRVDKGHVEGQEDHVHYKDGTSSTVSGKIHDKHKGIPNPSNKVKEWLEKNGWEIPE